MPRKKPSKHKLHGWRRRTESGEHLVDRLSCEFGIQSNSYSNSLSIILSSQSYSAEEADSPKKNRS